ncbi:MAG: hypothetical protein JSS09_05510 [Verrucomicrobia bacterium]|nr:hypothetical protein [Verrucomicrobiota bacterium]
MSFPTVGQTATAAIGLTGGVGAWAAYAATQSQSTPNTVGLAVLSLGSSALNIGFISAYIRSDANTTPKQYIRNGISNTGPVIATGVTIATQTFVKAAFDGMSRAIQDNVYDYCRGNNQGNRSKPKDSI